MTPPNTIFINPYLLFGLIVVVLMGIGVSIYVGLVRLVRAVRNRPKKITHKYKLPSPEIPTPIGVEYSNKIQLKEPTTLNIHLDEWDWQ